MATNKLLIGNWKLNHTKASAGVFFQELLKKFQPNAEVDVAIAPVATLLDFCQARLLGSGIKLCAQNVFYENSGAYTGEWSVNNLTELGVDFCIVGHSERRQIFGETNEDVAKKAKSCMGAKIVPVVCIGESQSEREAGTTIKVIEAQVLTVLEQVESLVEKAEFVFAYEPVWAIGTGVSANKVQVQQVHEIIREILRKNFTRGEAKLTRILYGGSVTPQNIREIVSMQDVDGALVGGASLQVETFLSMVKELGLDGRIA